LDTILQRIYGVTLDEVLLSMSGNKYVDERMWIPRASKLYGFARSYGYDAADLVKRQLSIREQDYSFVTITNNVSYKKLALLIHHFAILVKLERMKSAKARTPDGEVDTQQTQGFEPVDVAMGRIKEIVEKSRNENPHTPILILLDGRCEDSSKNYYGNEYKNFGLDLNQDVIVTQGDILRALFKKKVNNPDEVEAIKIFYPGMAYEVVAEDTEWIKGRLKEDNSLIYTRYLGHYIEIAFGKMKELRGTKDRIIVFDEADSHTYFEDTLNSNAPEDILVIKARLRLKPDEGDKREMSIDTSMWSSIPSPTSPGDTDQQPPGPKASFWVKKTSRRMVFPPGSGF